MARILSLGSRFPVHAPRSHAIERAAVLLTVAVMALALTACGDDSDTSTANGQATAGEGSDGGATSAEAKAKSTFEEEHPGSAEFGSPPLEFEADPNGDLAYADDELTAKDGNVTIEFTNPQSTPHNVTVEALPSRGRVETDTIEDGFAAVTVTLNTEERFIFFCTVPGHRKAGMEGTIRVKPRVIGAEQAPSRG